MESSSTTVLRVSEFIAEDAHGYLYDNASQRTRHTRPDGAYFDLGYDGAGQLTRAWATNSGGTAITTQRYTYGYDAAFNMVKRTNNTTVETFTANNLNQYTAFPDNSTGRDSTGNLTSTTKTSGDSINYTYDDENQLTTVATDTTSTLTGYRWKIDFVYDGKMRLRKRTNYSWSTLYTDWIVDSEVRYVYDGMLLVQERSSANRPTVSYTRGSDLRGSLSRAGGIGGLLARNTHGTTSPYSVNGSAFYHADAGGNVTYLLNQNQTVGAKYTYDPYGRNLASSGTLASANGMRFSSKPWINHGNASTTVLYYYGYRFYHPELQRWINRDPLGESGFELIRGGRPKAFADGSNLYRFVGNNPVYKIDPMGLLMYNPLGWPSPGNNPWDRLAHAFPVTRCAMAVREAQSMLGNISNDARAHCIASCKIASACGQGISGGLGNLKEIRDLLAGGLEWTVSWIIPSSWEESLHDHLQGGTIDDSADDFYANNHGLDVANDSAGSNCVCECEKQFGAEP